MHARSAAAAAVLCLMMGCNAERIAREQGAPLDVAGDTEQTTRVRAAAVRSALADPAADPDARRRQREGVKSIAWRRSEFSGIRLAAIEALADDDADDTAEMLALMLPTETQWVVIEGVSEMAIARSWVGLTPALVRSFSRVVPTPLDKDRPEMKALAALHPGRRVEEVVFEVFAAPVEEGSLFGEKARNAAWEALSRIDGDGSWTAQRIAALDETLDETGDELLRDLRSAARELGAVPRTADELAWLRRMRSAAHVQKWHEASAVARGLNEEQRAGLGLRHAAGLRWAQAYAPEYLSATRDELYSRLDALLDDRRRVRRVDGYPDPSAAPPETLREWGGDLSWADLLMLLVAEAALRDEGVVRALFEQADADRRDESTEHGGLLDADRGASSSSALFRASGYAPRATQRVADNRFVASPEMIEDSVHALFHYHFHAQRVNNEAYAGPGAGDLEYTARLGRACLVFTSISRDTLNADYYQPGGARIDLGVLRRPR